jgi:hypothetical protein
VLTQLADRYSSPGDERDQDEAIVAAWRHKLYHDTELVERYARAFLSAVAVQWWDDPRGASRIFGYLTRETAEAEGIPDPADYLASEMATYVAWCEGNVCSYIVEDGRQHPRLVLRLLWDRELPTSRPDRRFIGADACTLRPSTGSGAWSQ